MEQLLCFVKNHLFFNKSKSLREIVLVIIIKSPYIRINNTIFKTSEKRASDKSIYIERQNTNVPVNREHINGLIATSNSSLILRNERAKYAIQIQTIVSTITIVTAAPI